MTGGTSHHQVEVAAGSTLIPEVAGHPVHAYWLLLAPHVREVLLAPQRRFGEQTLVWTWEGPDPDNPPTPAELATLRERLGAVLDTLASSMEARAADSAMAQRPELISGVTQVLNAWARPLLRGPDQRLQGYVARTCQGLYLHSWALSEPARAVRSPVDRLPTSGSPGSHPPVRQRPTRRTWGRAWKLVPILALVGFGWLWISRMLEAPDEPVRAPSVLPDAGRSDPPLGAEAQSDALTPTRASSTPPHVPTTSVTASGHPRANATENAPSIAAPNEKRRSDEAFVGRLAGPAFASAGGGNQSGRGSLAQGEGGMPHEDASTGASTSSGVPSSSTDAGTSSGSARAEGDEAKATPAVLSPGAGDAAGLDAGAPIYAPAPAAPVALLDSPAPRGSAEQQPEPLSSEPRSASSTPASPTTPTPSPTDRFVADRDRDVNTETVPDMTVVERPDHPQARDSIEPANHASNIEPPPGPPSAPAPDVRDARSSAQFDHSADQLIGPDGASFLISPPRLHLFSDSILPTLPVASGEGGKHAREVSDHEWRALEQTRPTLPQAALRLRLVAHLAGSATGSAEAQGDAVYTLDHGTKLDAFVTTKQGRPIADILWDNGVLTTRPAAGFVLLAWFEIDVGDAPARSRGWFEYLPGVPLRSTTSTHDRRLFLTPGRPLGQRQTFVHAIGQSGWACEIDITAVSALWDQP